MRHALSIKALYDIITPYSLHNIFLSNILTFLFYVNAINNTLGFF